MIRKTKISAIRDRGALKNKRRRGEDNAGNTSPIGDVWHGVCGVGTDVDVELRLSDRVELFPPVNHVTSERRASGRRRRLG